MHDPIRKTENVGAEDGHHNGVQHAAPRDVFELRPEKRVPDARGDERAEPDGHEDGFVAQGLAGVPSLIPRTVSGRVLRCVATRDFLHW